MNSGLCLVLLLRLYEQRFAELMRLNHNQDARERVSPALPGPSGSSPANLALPFIRCASTEVLKVSWWDMALSSLD